MSVKEIPIDIGEGVMYPVKLSYRFLEKEDMLNLIGNSTYIFTAIISVDTKEQLVFGQARKHAEFLQAIKRDKKNFLYSREDLGQIDVDEYGKIGIVQFAYCTGKDDVRNQERANLIFQSISSEIFDPEIDIVYAGTIRCSYDSASRKMKVKEDI